MEGGISGALIDRSSNGIRDDFSRYQGGSHWDGSYRSDARSTGSLESPRSRGYSSRPWLRDSPLVESHREYEAKLLHANRRHRDNDYGLHHFPQYDAFDRDLESNGLGIHSLNPVVALANRLSNLEQENTRLRQELEDIRIQKMERSVNQDDHGDGVSNGQHLDSEHQRSSTEPVPDQSTLIFRTNAAPKCVAPSGDIHAASDSRGHADTSQLIQGQLNNFAIRDASAPSRDPAGMPQPDNGYRPLPALQDFTAEKEQRDARQVTKLPSQFTTAAVQKLVTEGGSVQNSARVTAQSTSLPSSARQSLHSTSTRSCLGVMTIARNLRVAPPQGPLSPVLSPRAITRTNVVSPAASPPVASAPVALSPRVSPALSPAVSPPLSPRSSAAQPSSPRTNAIRWPLSPRPPSTRLTMSPIQSPTSPSRAMSWNNGILSPPTPLSAAGYPSRHTLGGPVSSLTSPVTPSVTAPWAVPMTAPSPPGSPSYPPVQAPMQSPVQAPALPLPAPVPLGSPPSPPPVPDGINPVLPQQQMALTSPAPPPLPEARWPSPPPLLASPRLSPVQPFVTPRIGLNGIAFTPEHFFQHPGASGVPTWPSGIGQEFALPDGAFTSRNFSFSSGDAAPQGSEKTTSTTVFQDTPLMTSPDPSNLPNHFDPNNLSASVVEQPEAANGADTSGMEGKTVLINGLVKHTHLNGKRATCVGFDQIKGRWKVVMEDGSFIRLLPENCRFV